MTNFYTIRDGEPKKRAQPQTVIPAFALSVLNHCNFPAQIIASDIYQQYPEPIVISGVTALHGHFFEGLAGVNEASERALHFQHYMRAVFLLGHSEQAGLSRETCMVPRDKLDYLRLLRGWMFNADGIEAAVMKRWVESRFGLLTLNHGGLVQEEGSDAYQTYHQDYVRGLYNSNALESQLDLLYSYCQYELQRQFPKQVHLSLYRAVNRLDKHNCLAEATTLHPLLLLNNLNSFSSEREQVDTFGDVIFSADVPLTKLLYFPELLPGVLKGEQEYLVIGGVYRVTITR